MAQYQVQDPQGETHLIEGPDDATPDQVMSQAQNLIPKSEPSELQSAGHAFVNNLPMGGNLAAGAESLPGVGTGKGYSENLKDWNAQTPIDKEANPISYGAGAVTGAMAPAVASLGESLPAQIATGAGIGALSAAGNTNLVKEPGKAALQGLGGGILGGTTAAAMSKIAPWLAEKFAATATTPEAASIAMKNPELLKNIPTTEELAQKLPDVVKKIDDQIGQHMDIAKDSLSTSKYFEDGAITKDEIFNVLHQARKELGGIYTSEGKKAAGALEELGDDLKKTHQTISQKNLYDVMQKIDNEIPWDKIHSRPDDVTAEEWAMVNVRRGMRNLLGQKNEGFGALMEPVSILEKDKGDLISKFGITRDVEGMRPGDQTVSRLSNALKQTEKSAKPESARVLENVNASAGEDLTTPLRLQAFKNPTPESPMGVPSRVGGAVVGSGAGSALGLKGVGLGAVAGQRVLRQPMSVLGRQAASKAIQNLPAIERGGTQGINQAIIDYLKKEYASH